MSTVNTHSTAPCPVLVMSSRRMSSHKYKIASWWFHPAMFWFWTSRGRIPRPVDLFHQFCCCVWGFFLQSCKCLDAHASTLVPLYNSYSPNQHSLIPPVYQSLNSLAVCIRVPSAAGHGQVAASNSGPLLANQSTGYRPDTISLTPTALLCADKVYSGYLLLSWTRIGPIRKDYKVPPDFSHW